MENIPSFLSDLLKNQYGDELTDKIIQGYQIKRATTFRINTLKADENVLKELDNAGISYEKVDGIKDAYILKSEVSLASLDCFKEGKIYLQSLSSMLPPIILEPEKKKDILDMAAAPGSKTSELAALVNNESNICACEVNKIRMDKLKYNCALLAATKVNFMLVDSRKLDDFFRFDQILLDAPCSGSGTLSIFDKSFTKFSFDLVKNSSVLQKQLLNKALTILKPGCTMVYSTCSILSKENEEVVNSVLKKFHCEIVPIELGSVAYLEMLPTTIPGTLCILPNKYYEGFYVAKIRKIK